MKKILPFLFFVAVSLSGFAQCIPDPNITTSGIYPDSATGLPHGTVGQPYSTDIQFRVPTDTVYLGLPATIVSIDITDVTGLPPGFSYSCTPSNCSFPGGSNGCILIQGPALTTPGSFPIVVNLLVNGTVFGSPQSITSSNDNYTIVIDNSTAITVPAGQSFLVGQCIPNPAVNFTSIPVTMVNNGKISLSISDLTGSLLSKKSYSVNQGNNMININTSELHSGIYLYTITSGNNTVTRRLIVSND